jgi:cytochrome P450
LWCRVRLNPRDPDFVDDPYSAYAAICEAAAAFFWQDYGFWCFTRFADVSALLRSPFRAQNCRIGLARCKTAS